AVAAAIPAEELHRTPRPRLCTVRAVPRLRAAEKRHQTQRSRALWGLFWDLCAAHRNGVREKWRRPPRSPAVPKGKCGEKGGPEGWACFIPRNRGAAFRCPDVGPRIIRSSGVGRRRGEPRGRGPG